MKTLKQENTSPKLIGEVHFARIRLAKAESRLAATKEQARLARRRRKEAKLVARRAKKQARLAKKELAEAKLILAQAEDKLARLKQRPFRIKPRKKPAKKAVAAPRKRKLARVVAIRARASVKRTEPMAKPANSRPRVSLKKKKAIRHVKVPRDFQTPGTIASTPVSEPTAQIVKGVEEIFAASEQTEATLVPNLQQPPDEHSSTPNQIVT